MAIGEVFIEDLWEQFKLREDRIRSLKEVASRFRLGGPKKLFWALRGVSFHVNPGEAVGLIGENGSGKSTLLKCIAGILPPTKGRVLVGGTVSSLIELGAGFHAELTGRENIMVTGALFGISRKILRSRFDEIVSFAELERVIDQPVRAYSSGMYIRLAFSLAVHVEPNILLIDEVLAVGDEAFQRKSVKKVGQLSQNGITVIFVSHDMPLVEQVCRRTVYLHSGQIEADGSTPEVIQKYFASERISNESAI